MEADISHQEKKMSNRYESEVPNEAIEEQTKKIPNLLFLGLGIASIFGSAALTISKRKTLGNFVGLWVPTLLILGVYNKMVKLEDEMFRLKMH